MLIRRGQARQSVELTMSRRTLLESAVLTPFVAGLPRRTIALGEADPAVVGSWSEPFDLGGVAIHATLLHTDDVLIFQYVEGDATVDHSSWVGTWNWQTQQTTEAPIPYHRDIFCAGHNVLADGRVFVAGGHDHGTGSKQDGVGVAECDVYDPVSRTWTPAPRLSEKRWYPTNVGLANGRTLVFGGQARSGTPAATVDEYDATTNSVRRLPATATKRLGVYPRMHLMPDGTVLRTGPRRTSLRFDPTTSTWQSLATLRYGDRFAGGAVLLPGARRVLAVGGGPSGTPTATAEILETYRGRPTWRYTGSLHYPRRRHNTVLLPDGTAIVVGGGSTLKYRDPCLVPELYDPATRAWSLLAPQQASRMYHSTAILLPDGRVLSAGQDDGPFDRYGEIFSPPYLFLGPRPVVAGCPDRVASGAQLHFDSPDAADLTEVVLIRPGSSTHGIDADQRSVPVPFQVSGTTVTAQVPANLHRVPPGYWLLFVLNGAGVPAVAPWLRIG